MNSETRPDCARPDCARPVFIIGGSRTGSEMLKTMLSTNTALDFSNELFLLCPRWLHKDLDTNIRQHVGDLSAPGAAESLVEFLYSGIPYGWMWTEPERELNREVLLREFTRQELNLGAVFESLMVCHATINGKSRTGAKFPLHYSRTDKLLEWFPDCYLLHTTRNPKAVYASQAAKYLEAGWPAWRTGYEKFRHFVHICIQTAWTARLHRRLCHLPNYRLVKYEDLVFDTEAQMRDLSGFVDVQYDPAMLKPSQYQSSFKRTNAADGVDPTLADIWRDKISPSTSRIIDLLLSRPAEHLGYSL